MAGRVRVSLVLLWMMIAAACAAASGPSPPTLYTVTATVMQVPGKPPRACAFEPLPYPPIGCGGPVVGGLDLLGVHGMQRYRNGVVATPFLHLVGSWHDRTLNLTRQPERALAKDATPVPQCDQHQQSISTDVPALMQRLKDDESAIAAHGIELLEFGQCGNDSFFIVVAVADREAVDFLTGHYGPIQIRGWLKPVT